MNKLREQDNKTVITLIYFWPYGLIKVWKLYDADCKLLPCSECDNIITKS